MEDNKLIAEFMGYRYQESNFFSVWEFYKSYEDRFVDGKYHESWDWLMPVVEKIESLRFENEDRYIATLWGTYTYFSKFNVVKGVLTNIKPYNQYYIGQGKNRITQTYKAVVEFIKWYNENK